MKFEDCKKINIKKIILKYLLILAVIILVFSSITIYLFAKENRNTKKIQNKKADVVEKVKPVKSIEPYYNELPTVRENYNNQNIMAKIEIPNMNINNYVTRTDNNSYYLNYNLYNVYDQIGAPFIDYRNTDLVNAKQINIYGHNTQNEAIYDKLPFVNLEKYTDQATFEANKTIYLYLDEKKVEYKIIAIKIVTTDIEHMKVSFSSDSDFKEHADKLLSDSLYREQSEKVTKKDRLLVLQICHYDPMGSYLLVIAKAVND